MYGSSTVLVLTTGQSVNGYTLDPDIGEFLLTHRDMKLGKKKIYSINEGNAHTFDLAVKTYVDSLKFPPPGHTGKFTPYSARYVGSMVADVSTLNNRRKHQRSDVFNANLLSILT
jgi:fructose-1,6-bisphosphatase I